MMLFKVPIGMGLLPWSGTLLDDHHDAAISDDCLFAPLLTKALSRNTRMTSFALQIGKR
jgi:hypothetical protein